MLWNLIILNPMIHALLIIYSGVSWLYILTLIGRFWYCDYPVHAACSFDHSTRWTVNNSRAHKKCKNSTLRGMHATQKKYKDDKQKLSKSDENVPADGD